MDMPLTTNMDREHGNGHEAWTRTCKMDIDMNMQHGHEYAAVTRRCSIDQDMDLDMDIDH